MTYYEPPAGCHGKGCHGSSCHGIDCHGSLFTSRLPWLGFNGVG